MRARLEISWAEGGWSLRYLPGHPEREETLALFGADVVPLPFTGQAPAEDVYAHVKRRYPDDAVSIGVAL